MKVEELYQQDQQSQIGVTLERQPFDTKVDIFPEISPPFWNSETRNQAGEPVGMAAELASPEMEEKICKVIKHQPLDTEEEFQPIPLKRIDSGPTSHCLQSLRVVEVPDTTSDASVARASTHQSLLDEIDKGDSSKKDVKTKTKKDSTLTRMKDRLKSMRGDKDDESKITSKSLGKILNRMNPVSKASRESFSKVFHRIGDVLQKKPDEDKEKEEKSSTIGQDKKLEDEERADAVRKTLAFKNNKSDQGLDPN